MLSNVSGILRLAPFLGFALIFCSHKEKILFKIFPSFSIHSDKGLELPLLLRQQGT